MAALPYPLNPARFAVDDQGVATDRRRQMLDSINSSMSGILNRLMPIRDAIDKNTFYMPLRDYSPRGADWEPKPSEATAAFEYATKPYRAFVTIDEVSSFDQDALDELVARTIRERQDRELAALIGSYSPPEPPDTPLRYTANPDTAWRDSRGATARAGHGLPRQRRRQTTSGPQTSHLPRPWHTPIVRPRQPLVGALRTRHGPVRPQEGRHGTPERPIHHQHR